MPGFWNLQTRGIWSAALPLALSLIFLSPAHAFAWSGVQMQASCEKTWPCGFTASYAGAAAADYNQPVNVYVLENGFTIEQVYRYYSEEPVPYSLPAAGSGEVRGYFTPGHFMQTQKNYTVVVEYAGQSANTTFQLNTYRNPDIIGDWMIWLNIAIPTLIFVFIVLFLCIVILKAFL